MSRILETLLELFRNYVNAPDGLSPKGLARRGPGGIFSPLSSIAQWLERLAVNQQVVGSNPTWGEKLVLGRRW